MNKDEMYAYFCAEGDVTRVPEPEEDVDGEDTDEEDDEDEDEGDEPESDAV